MRQLLFLRTNLTFSKDGAIMLVKNNTKPRKDGSKYEY